MNKQFKPSGMYSESDEYNLYLKLYNRNNNKKNPSLPVFNNKYKHSKQNKIKSHIE